MSDTIIIHKAQSPFFVVNIPVFFSTNSSTSVRIDTVLGSSRNIGTGSTGLAYRHSPVRASFLSHRMAGSDGTMQRCKDCGTGFIAEFSASEDQCRECSESESSKAFWEMVELLPPAAEPETPFDLEPGR